MRLSTFIPLLALGSSAAGTDCKPRNPDGYAASDELAAWIGKAVDDFYPFRDTWASAYDASFAPNLSATFNATKFDFNTLRAAYGSFLPKLQGQYAGTFGHGYYSVVAVPHASDRGGFVYITGWAGGYIDGDADRLYNVSHAAFGVVEQQEDCSIKIAEWRESSNMAPSP
ncbi:unnamed protein product [Clonostachys rosea f. rosea IK726]|uniref:Uncharacterized protein n=1 Tax=Clonostachys rosea f. rosea IK726 TaxID=1349383 RepID=A0ACA9TMS9_BIOOC|nr:unnamed protein product [Clonostachys rosea f. rosea IK726]